MKQPMKMASKSSRVVECAKNRLFGVLVEGDALSRLLRLGGPVDDVGRHPRGADKIKLRHASTCKLC